MPRRALWFWPGGRDPKPCPIPKPKPLFPRTDYNVNTSSYKSHLRPFEMCQQPGKELTDKMADSNRIASASGTFARLHKAKVWTSEAWSLPLELQFLQSIVMSVLLCGGETWMLLAQHLGALSVFHMQCFRRICCISFLDNVSNQQILSK